MNILEIYDKQLTERQQVQKEIDQITEELKDVDNKIKEELKKGVDEPKKLIKTKNKLKKDLSVLVELQSRLVFNFTLADIREEMLKLNIEPMKQFQKEKQLQEHLQKQFIEEMKASAKRQLDYLNEVHTTKVKYDNLRQALGYNGFDADFLSNFAGGSTVRFYSDCSKFL